jgi:hypothetical protein
MYDFAYKIQPTGMYDDGEPKYPLGLPSYPSLKAKLQAAKRVRERPSMYERQRCLDPRTLAYALAILANGRPYFRHWCDEGNGESGPMGFTEFGVRWGELRLVRHTNGDVSLYRSSRHGDENGCAEMWTWVHLSGGAPRGLAYFSQGAMIRDHLDCLRGNAERNGVQFVVTGERPSDRDDKFHIDNILARENRLRDRRAALAE